MSQRLRDLEDTGVVRHDMLDPPASVAVYELTDRGRALEPVLIELGRWGRQETTVASAELSVSALLLALKTVFDPRRAIDSTVAIRVNGKWFSVTVDEKSIAITHGRAAEPDVTLLTDVPTLRSIVFGRQRIATAERHGRLTVVGDRDMAELFTRPSS